MHPRAPDFVRCVGALDTEFDYVYHVLRRHGIALSDVEDLVQEVFLVMWRRWGQYDSGRPIRPWLAGIAFRVAYNHRQRASREVPGGFIDLPDETPDPEQTADSDKARSLVWTVLAALPEKHRSLLLTHDVDGVSVREIADALAVPVPTAHTRLRAARRAFAKAVKQHEAISTTRARIAPLLQSPLAPDETHPPPASRKRALARARRLALLPGFGLGAVEQPPPPAWSLPRTWLPVGGAALVGGVGLLLLLIFGDAPAQSPASFAGSAVALTTVEAAPAHSPAGPRSVFSSSAPSFVSIRPAGHGLVESESIGLGRALIGYWRFDEASGSGSARDLSGTGNDCLLRKLDPGGAWTEGKLGGAIALNGQGWLECPRVDALARLGSDLTISLWLRRQGKQQHVRALVTRQYGAGVLDNFHFGLRDDQLWMRTRFRGQATVAPFPPARGHWYHLAATLESTGRTRLYIDGEEVIQRRRDGQPPLGGGSNPLIIGGGVNGPDSGQVNELFQGVIDELLVYARKLDPAELRALASGMQPRLSR
jgi:RNA polymerase sigma-70 factor, ECF subfamily